MPVTPFRASLLLLFASACGGVVVIDREDVEEDGSTSAAGGRAAAPEAPSPAAAGDSHPDSCVSDCGAWMGACEDDRRCAEPRDVCQPTEAELAKNVVACVCAGCAERCGGNCALFNGEDASCLACQQTMIRQTCNFEYYACVGF